MVFAGQAAAKYICPQTRCTYSNLAYVYWLVTCSCILYPYSHYLRRFVVLNIIRKVKHTYFVLNFNNQKNFKDKETALPSKQLPTAWENTCVEAKWMARRLRSDCLYFAPESFNPFTDLLLYTGRFPRYSEPRWRPPHMYFLILNFFYFLFRSHAKIATLDKGEVNSHCWFFQQRKLQQ